MERMKELESNNIGRLLIKFSIPSMIGTFVFALYNIVDRIFIGKGLGTNAMAAVSITFPMFAMIVAIGMMIGIGGATNASIKLGQKNKDEAEKILGNVFSLFFIFAIILMGVGFIYLEEILTLFGATVYTLTYAKDYMSFILVAIFANFISFGVNGMVRAEGNAKIAMFTMMIGAFLNIVLDPFFIFGTVNIPLIGLGILKLPGLDLGIKGAAIATSIANTVSAIWVIYHFTFSKKSNLKLRRKNLYLFPKIVASIFKIGISPFILQISVALVGIVANKILIEYGGDRAVAAMGIISTVNFVIMIIIIGIVQGSQPIIGYNYGAKKYRNVIKALDLSMIAALILSVFALIIINLIPKILVSAFNKDDIELLKLSARGLRIFLCLVFLGGVQIIGANYFQAVGKAKISIYLNLAKQILFLIPLLFLLPYFFALDGVWLAGPISEILAFIVTIIFIQIEKKRLKELIEE